MKRPILPSEIRPGDLIRWEAADSASATFASEFRAGGANTKGYRGHGTYYLLDRPVELPTEPTLGWLTFYAGEESSGLGRHLTRLAVYEPYSDGLTDNADAGMWPASTIIAFTPATAVPRTALNILREKPPRKDRVPKHWYRNRTARFLTAVDEANA